MYARRILLTNGASLISNLSRCSCYITFQLHHGLSQLLALVRRRGGCACKDQRECHAEHGQHKSQRLYACRKHTLFLLDHSGRL